MINEASLATICRLKLLKRPACRKIAIFNNASYMLLLVTITALFLISCVECSSQQKKQLSQQALLQQQQQSGHYRRFFRRMKREADWYKSYLEMEREKETHFRRTQFIEKLFHSYDRRVLPNLDGPTTVNCSLFINNFDSISEVTMDYAVGVYLRQAWVDPRLKFDPTQNNNETMVTLDAKSFDKLWVPDLFFTNEKRASFHSITVPNRLICVMDLRKFPLDSQICTMMIESYAYTTDKIILQWRSDPLEISPDLIIPQFNLRNFTFADCSKRYATGNFSCLKASFYLDRDVGYYIIQTYLPSVLVVVLSWVAFWIDPTAVPARVTFGVFTTLILSTMSSSVRSTLPRVSYVKAIDVWMSVCMFFVFTALIEYAIVNVVLRQKPKRPLKPNVQNTQQLQLQQQLAQQAQQQPQSSGLLVNRAANTSRTPSYEPASPAMSHLLAPSQGGDSEYGESIQFSTMRDEPKAYQRGNAFNKHGNSNNNNNAPEIWIPLEAQQQAVPNSIEPQDATRSPPPSSLSIIPRDNINPTNSKTTDQAAGVAAVDNNNNNNNNAQVVDDSLLMRGPANIFDICYYWHRTMTRLAEMEGKEKGQMVENWARKIFPLSFFIFNVIYWIVYLYYI